MPPFRFLHSAGLDLDVVLPEPPARLVDLYRSGPLLAFERLIACAIEQRADFVLITPAAPISGLPDGPSLAAESVLLDQFGQLCNEEIAVFIAVRSRTSPWQRLADRAANVTVLPVGSFSPVADRSGRPTAVLRCVDRPSIVTRPLPAGPNDVLEFAVAPALTAEALRGVNQIGHDYLGLNEASRSTLTFKSAIAHSPGPLQATNATETGPRGATLVVVDEGQVRTEFISTAAVRFESISVRAESSDELDDLAIAMIDRLNDSSPEPGEQAWAIRWRIEAAGKLFETLNHPAGRMDLIGLLPESIGSASLTHRLAVVPHPLWLALEDPLAAEYAAALQEQSAGLCDAGGRLKLLGVTTSTQHHARLTKLVGALNVDEILGDARRFGLGVVANAANETIE